MQPQLYIICVYSACVLCVYSHMYMYIYIYIYMTLYTHIYVYIYIYICMHESYMNALLVHHHLIALQVSKRLALLYENSPPFSTLDYRVVPPGEDHLGLLDSSVRCIPQVDKSCYTQQLH